MTTHVFIVNNNTFKYHLEYLFAGTGSKESVIDFNNNTSSSLHHSTERTLVGIMADGCRIRENDYIIFYVQSYNGYEGRFYGIFQATANTIFLDNNTTGQFLKNQLGKSLTFRTLIKPYRVYSNGVTEWEALDEIRNISSPCQMLWSLIYRKLKGNRGNTMITTYEALRLFDLLGRKNNWTILNDDNNIQLSFDANNSNIIKEEHRNNIYEFDRMIPINILPRLCYLYSTNRSHEVHLQMYISQNIGKGTNVSLDNSILGNNCRNIEWIGNEMSCGVGMQRMDIVISKRINDTDNVLMPIELKSVELELHNFKQVLRYIDWIEQYYCPNSPCAIQPIIISKKPRKDLLKEKSIIIQGIIDFNSNANGRFLPIKIVQYYIIDNCIEFEEFNYLMDELYRV